MARDYRKKIMSLPKCYRQAISDLMVIYPGRYDRYCLELTAKSLVNEERRRKLPVGSMLDPRSVKD